MAGTDEADVLSAVEGNERGNRVAELNMRHRISIVAQPVTVPLTKIVRQLNGYMLGSIAHQSSVRTADSVLVTMAVPVIPAFIWFRTVSTGFHCDNASAALSWQHALYLHADGSLDLVGYGIHLIFCVVHTKRYTDGSACIVFRDLNSLNNMR